MPDRRQGDRREASFSTKSIKISLMSATYIIIIVAIICISILVTFFGYKKGFNNGYDKGYSDGFVHGQEYFIDYDGDTEFSNGEDTEI